MSDTGYMRRALELAAPAFYHCDLLSDEGGVRLAKRHDALSLRALERQATRYQAFRKAGCGDGGTTGIVACGNGMT